LNNESSSETCFFGAFLLLKKMPLCGKKRGAFLRLRRKEKRQTARYAGKKKGQKNAPKARKGFGASQKG
jgi:hypothetical protein